MHGEMSVECHGIIRASESVSKVLLVIPSSKKENPLQNL